MLALAQQLCDDFEHCSEATVDALKGLLMTRMVAPENHAMTEIRLRKPYPIGSHIAIDAVFVRVEDRVVLKVLIADDGELHCFPPAEESCA